MGSAETEKDEGRLTGLVIGAAIEVHKELGPGLLESAYQIAMAHELTLRRLRFRDEWPLRVQYKGIALDQSYRVDFIVEDELVVELKAVERVLPVHEAQLLSYLRLMKKPIGLLINFHYACPQGRYSPQSSLMQGPPHFSLPLLLPLLLPLCVSVPLWFNRGRS